MSMLGNLVGAALGMLTFALLARVTTKEEFGIFTLFTTFQILSSIARNGLVGRPLVKYLSENSAHLPEQNSFIKAAWKLGWRVSTFLGLGMAALFVLLYALGAGSDFLVYALFILPVMLVSFPQDMGTWVLSSRLQFDKQVYIRMTMQLVYMAGASLLWWIGADIFQVLSVYLLANMGSSLLVLLSGWARSGQGSGQDTRSYRSTLLAFGRYSVGTMIGGNFLRSSDVILLRVFLGAPAVAAYEVSQRLVNLIDIPLRALISYAFPTLSRSRAQKSRGDFIREYETNAGFTFLSLFPLALLSFIFAEPLVTLLGGAKYAESATLLRIFAVYMAITSVDRFSGVALDIFNRPRRNFHKVMLMLTVNILGDLIALYYFESLAAVAAVTIATFSSGIIFGMLTLRKELPFRPWRWLVLGSLESRRIVKKIVSKSA